MRYSSLLSPLAIALVASPAMVSAQSIPRPPQFEAVFAGYFNVSSHHNTTGPFGTRVHNAMGGGSMLDAKTGRVVATILPFADNGVFGSSEAGPSFPDAVMPLVWEEDGRFASVTTSGVRSGGEHRSLQYTHVETDSPTYSWMNAQFLITMVDASTPERLAFTMYKESIPGSRLSASSPVPSKEGEL